MKIVFKKIPKLAIYFYSFGFLILAVALYLFFYRQGLIEPLRLQQIFIAGAIIVALGSMINSVFQFKPDKSKEKQKN